jgi:predicted  nucleic acid-binding Zn-ribbon protein
MLTIDAMYEQIEKNEERLKAIKTEREEIQKRVDENNLKLGELQKDLGEYEKQLEELNKEHEEEERDLMLQRNENLSKLDDETKNLYEKINGTFAGEATAIVRKGNCSGCFNVIPPQRVIEIRQAEDIYTCQSCGRILIDESIVNS